MRAGSESRAPEFDIPPAAAEEQASPPWLVAELQRRVEELELELQRHRQHEREVGAARLEAIRAAATIRGAARREAEAALKKAHARAAELVAQGARERERLDRELAQRQVLAEEAEHGLLEVLRQSLEQLNALGTEEPPAERPDA